MERTELARGLAGTIVAAQIIAFVKDFRDGTRDCVRVDSITMPAAANLPLYTYHITSYSSYDEAFNVHVRVMEGKDEVTNETIGDQLDTIREETGETMHVVQHNVGYGIMLEFPGL
jgi:hypothetical protein